MNKNHLKAILYLVLAAVLWSTGGILIKLVNWNPVAIAGGRSGFSALLMMLYMRKAKVKITSQKSIGAMAYASTVILFVVANKMTTAANTILLQYTAPIWVALMAGWFLKEKTKVHDWITIVLVFGGMTLFFMGDLETGQMLGNIVAVLSGIAFGGTIVSLRMMKNGSPVEMAYLGNILTFLISVPFILQSVPDFNSIIGVILLGVFQLGASYILFSEAIKHVNALEAILIPVIEPLLNPIWVFMFVGEKPGGLALLGGIIVISSVLGRGIYVNYHVYNARVSKEQLSS